MATLVQPEVAAEIIGSAFDVLSDRHPAAEQVQGALAGLRLVRQAIHEHAGYAAMRQFDDWLFEQVEQRRHQAILRGATVPVGPVPEVTSGTARASQIVRDAVFSCFFLNAHAPGNSLLLTGSGALLDAIEEAQGALPDWPVLMDAIQIEDERGVLEETAGGGMIRLQ
jgi:hypothetical protein